jgi:hypothetical protein
MRQNDAMSISKRLLSVSETVIRDMSGSQEDGEKLIQKNIWIY